MSCSTGCSCSFRPSRRCAAGLSHVFKFREDGVRYTTLAEGVRSQLWRYQTRSGELHIALTDDQALDRLVVNVDGLNLQSLARWSASSLPPTKTPQRQWQGD